jgi:hypothetical protein
MQSVGERFSFSACVYTEGPLSGGGWVPLTLAKGSGRKVWRQDYAAHDLECAVSIPMRIYFNNTSIVNIEARVRSALYQGGLLVKTFYHNAVFPCPMGIKTVIELVKIPYIQRDDLGDKVEVMTEVDMRATDGDYDGVGGVIASCVTLIGV